MADVAIHLYDMSDVGFAKLYKQNPPSPDRLPTGAVGAYATSTAAQIVGAILCTAVRKPSSGAPAFVPARAA